MFVVFDLDGTLADCQHRIPHIEGPTKDWRSFFAACVDDAPIAHAISVLHALYQHGHDVEIWSGRSDEVRHETELWLERRGIPWEVKLTRMRRAGDHRNDDELKREFLAEATAEGRRPDLVFDDRDRVVAMWRAEGIPCFQVAPGEF